MERTRLVPLPALMAVVLGGALLVGCQAQPLRLLPQERYAIDNPYTDIDAYDTRDYRNDTEIPNQYPHGTTRSRDDEAHGEAHGDEHGDEHGRPYDVSGAHPDPGEHEPGEAADAEPGAPEGSAEHDASILPDAVGTDAEQGEGDEHEGEDGH